jgi:hypothetical protein
MSHPSVFEVGIFTSRIKLSSFDAYRSIIAEIQQNSVKKAFNESSAEYL